MEPALNKWQFIIIIIIIIIIMTSRYTTKGSAVYAFFHEWPENDELVLGSPRPISGTKVTMLGYKGSEFKWSAKAGGGIIIAIPPISISKLPCLWAWTLKLENLNN